MKNIVCALAGSLLLGTSIGVIAGEDMKMGMDMKIKMMDVNSDGMISKAEYMAYHEKMWSNMKKDSMGMVDSKMMMEDHKKDSMKSDDAMKSDSMNKQK